MSRLFLGYYGEVTAAVPSPARVRPAGHRSADPACRPSLGSSPRFPARAGKQMEKAGPAGTVQARLRTCPDRPPLRGVKAQTPTLKLKWSGRAESNRRDEFGKLTFCH